MAMSSGYGSASGSFSQVARDLQSTVVSFSAATAASRAFLGSLNAFREFEKQLTLTNSVADGTAQTFNKMRDAAINMSLATRSSAQETASALYFLASAGLSAKDSVQALSGVVLLAQATLSDVGRVSDLVANSMSAFGLSADQSMRVSNLFAASISKSQGTIEKFIYGMKQVAPVAHAAGISIEDTTTALSLLWNSGQHGEQAGTTLRNVILRLIDPTAQTKQILDKLGITVVDAAGKLNDLTDTLSQLRSQNLTEGTLAQIFGRSALAGAITLMESTKTTAVGVSGEVTTAWKTMNASISNTQYAVKIAADQMATFEQQFKMTTNSINVFGIAIGEQLSKAVMPFMAAIRFLADGFANLTRGEQATIVQTGLWGAAIVGTVVALKAVGVASSALGIASMFSSATSSALTFRQALSGVLNSMGAVTTAQRVMPNVYTPGPNGQFGRTGPMTMPSGASAIGSLIGTAGKTVAAAGIAYELFQFIKSMKESLSGENAADILATDYEKLTAEQLKAFARMEAADGNLKQHYDSVKALEASNKALVSGYEQRLVDMFTPDQAANQAIRDKMKQAGQSVADQEAAIREFRQTQDSSSITGSDGPTNLFAASSLLTPELLAAANAAATRANNNITNLRASIDQLGGSNKLTNDTMELLAQNFHMTREQLDATVKKMEEEAGGKKIVFTKDWDEIFRKQTDTVNQQLLDAEAALRGDPWSKTRASINRVVGERRNQIGTLTTEMRTKMAELAGGIPEPIRALVSGEATKFGGVEYPSYENVDRSGKDVGAAADERNRLAVSALSAGGNTHPDTIKEMTDRSNEFAANLKKVKVIEGKNIQQAQQEGAGEQATLLRDMKRTQQDVDKQRIDAVVEQSELYPLNLEAQYSAKSEKIRADIGLVLLNFDKDMAFASKRNPNIYTPAIVADMKKSMEETAGTILSVRTQALSQALTIGAVKRTGEIQTAMSEANVAFNNAMVEGLTLNPGTTGSGLAGQLKSQIQATINQTYDTAIAGINDKIVTTQVALTNDQLRPEIRINMEATLELLKRQAVAIADVRDQRLKDADTAEMAAQNIRAANIKLLDQYDLMHKETGSVFEGFSSGASRWLTNMETDFQTGQKLFQTVADQLGDTFANLFSNNTQTFSQSLSDMASKLAQFLAKAVFMQVAIAPLARWMGLGNQTPVPGGSSGFGASGNVFGFADGGIVGPGYGGAVVRRMAAGDVAMAGEGSSPEGILPLKRDSNGQLGVSASGMGGGGGGGTQFNYSPSFVFNVGAGGGKTSNGSGNDSDSRMNSLKELSQTLDKAVSEKVHQVLLAESHPGGMLAS